MFGYSRQAFYKHQQLQFATLSKTQLIIEQVLHIRKQQPRCGGRKLLIMLQPFFEQQNIIIGRDAFFNLLALSIKTKKGQVLIVVCSHSEVENIVKETKNITNDKIELVYGGFHLIPFNRAQTFQIINMLKSDLQVHRVAPTHCTGHLGFKILKDIFGTDYLYAGLSASISY